MWDRAFVLNRTDYLYSIHAYMHTNINRKRERESKRGMRRGERERERESKRGMRREERERTPICELMYG